MSCLDYVLAPLSYLWPHPRSYPWQAQIEQLRTLCRQCKYLEAASTRDKLLAQLQASVEAEVTDMRVSGGAAKLQLQKLLCLLDEDMDCKLLATRGETCATSVQDLRDDSPESAWRTVSSKGETRGEQRHMCSALPSER